MTEVNSGEILQRLRRGVGIKQKDLAMVSGIAQTTISRIECGERVPYRRTLLKLARGLQFFGCEDAGSLVGGDWYPFGPGGEVSSFIRRPHIAAPVRRGKV